MIAFWASVFQHFVNDMYFFIEVADVVNYADDFRR